MNETDIAGKALITFAQPFFDRGDKQGLAAALGERWTPSCLALLLRVNQEEVVLAALRCLGLVGTSAETRAVAALLHHHDFTIVKAAEDTLWSIGFRSGPAAAQQALSEILHDVTQRKTHNIVSRLDALVLRYPQYAEVFHQRGQAHCLRENFQDALRDASRACALNPLHFAAWALQANALIGMDRMHEAQQRLREVLHVHPRMEGVRETMQHVRHRLGAAPDSRLVYS